MASLPASNLFEITSIANDWHIIDPDGFQSAWVIKPDGIVTQTETIGTRKQGSGSLLILKESGTINERLDLTIEVSSVYQVGMVFNYKDSDDYCIFVIDRKGVSFDGYEIKIVEIRSGVAKNICIEKYSTLAKDIMALSIIQEKSSLVFKVLEEEVYSWSNKDIKFGHVGLYSYKSIDGKFLNLIYDQDSELSIPQEDEPYIGDASDVSNSDPKKKEVNSELISFLGIQKPESKTTIDFKEVYSVPLDEYYQSILNTNRLESEEKNVLNMKSIVEYLDIRTKRWYRLYDDFTLKLKYAENDYEISSRKVNISLNKINMYLENEENIEETFLSLDNLERELEENRASMAHRKNRIYKYRDGLSRLLREIRTNGYDVKNNTKIEKIIEAGFEFQIDKSVLENRYKTVDLDPRTWLGDDDRGNNNWDSFLNLLKNSLLESDLLSEGSRDEYHHELESLINTDSNDELTEEIDNLKQIISNLNKRIVYDENHKEALSAKRDLLMLDMNDLKRLRQQFYQSITSGNIDNLGWDERLSFTKNILSWLEGKDDFGVYRAEKILNTDSDPGRKYFRKETNSYYIFRETNINNASRNYEWNKRELGNRKESGVVTDSIYAMRVFTYLMTDKFIYTITNNTNYPPVIHNLTMFTLSVLSTAADTRNTYNSDRIGIDFDTGRCYLFDTQWIAKKMIEFFDGAIYACEEDLKFLRSVIDSNSNQVIKSHNDIVEHNREITAISEYGLHKQRWGFIKKWNNPEKNGTGIINRKPIHPANDPLAEFLIETSKEQENINNEVMFFQPTSSGFYNQLGQSLDNFMATNSDRNTVVVLPYFDSAGGISDEVIQVVRGPVPSTKAPSMPGIKLVEYYTLEVGWQGFALGELSHSFNLLPGESKELVAEKSTKKTSKISEKIGREEARKQTATSSFEDNLKNELSNSLKDSLESDAKTKDSSSNKSLDKNSSSDESSSSQDITETQDRNWEVSAKADANWGWGSAEISGSTGGKSNINANTKSNRKSTWNNSNEDAYEISKSTEGQLKSNQSSEVMNKNLSNSVKKVANETSLNNKLEFSSTSSEEYQEESSNKEVIKLENPNIGKTINYNFFQVQNVYGTKTNISDVKIVVDSGKELIDKTGINDVKVYEVEEFGKIFCNSDGSDREAIISAIIARKVLNHYANIPPYFNSGNGAVQLPSGYEVDNEKFKIISYLGGDACRAHLGNDEDIVEQSQIELLKGALHYLKKLPFQFKVTPQEVDAKESRIYVNAAAYHVESQLGYKNATEGYLEERRNLETDLKRAELAHLKAQTDAGVFEKLPDGVTHLNYSKNIEE